YPAHGFRMAQANVSTPPEAIIEVFCGNPAGRVVEIDQHIPAEDDVEIPVARHVLLINEVDTGELHRIPQSGVNSDLIAFDPFEIAIDNIARKPHQSARAIDTFSRSLERARVDVGCDDLDIMAIDFAPVLHQPHRDRIRLFAGRTWYRPNAN